MSKQTEYSSSGKNDVAVIKPLTIGLNNLSSFSYIITQLGLLNKELITFRNNTNLINKYLQKIILQLKDFDLDNNYQSQSASYPEDISASVKKKKKTIGKENKRGGKRKSIDKSNTGIQSYANAIQPLSNAFDDIGSNIRGMKSIVKATDIFTPFIAANSSITSLRNSMKLLGMHSKDIDKLTIAAMKFSNQFGGTTTSDFLRSAEIIKSGIANISASGINDLTKMAALTGEATKTSSDSMSNIFTQNYGAFRKSFENDEDFADKFSNVLSKSVSIFRISGDDFGKAISDVSSQASDMGLSMSEQFAVIGSLSKNGFGNAMEAAGGYCDFLLGVNNAQKTLGLTFTDSKGKMLPMADVLDTIKSKYDGAINSDGTKNDLAKAFGSQEAVKVITSLADKVDNLRQAKDELNTSMEEGNFSKNQAQMMQMGQGFEIWSNQVSNLTSVLGSGLYPALSTIIGTIGGLCSSLAVFLQNNQWIIDSLGSIVVALFTGITAIKTIVIAIRAFAAAQAILNVIMSLNPIFGIIAACVALVVIIGTIISHFHEIEDFFKNSFIGKLFSGHKQKDNNTAYKDNDDMTVTNLSKHGIIYPDTVKPSLGEYGNLISNSSADKNTTHNFTYSPQITVGSGADIESMSKVLGDDKKDFSRQMDAYIGNQKRLGYANQ